MRNFPSERVLIFISVMLSVTEWCVKVLMFDDSWIGVRIGQWLDVRFGLLVQEADRCDSGLKHSR